MASAPAGSPPSPSISSPPPSPVENSPPPRQSASPPPPASSSPPPPKSSAPPEQSKSSPPPSSSPASPPPPPPSSSSSSSSPPPPLPSSSSSSSPPPPSKQNNASTTNPTPSSLPPPPPPMLTPENGSSTRTSPPKMSPPPPPKSHHSSTSNDDSGSDTLSSPSLPIVIGVSVGVALLFILIIALIVAVCTRKKKKSKFDNHIQYYKSSMPPNGGVGYGNALSQKGKNNMNNGYQANDHHLVINLSPPPGGNPGRGGWPLSPQGQIPPLTSEPSPSYPGHERSPSLPPAYPSMAALGHNQSSFSYEELAVATHGFSEANLLGEGGFGFVHKGVLSNGKEVAVKSLKSGSRQGEREFHAEVEIISRVHHRHLVSLVGYCMAGDKTMLVYEFLTNKTLEFHLHEKGLPTMDWPTRLKIALGAAKGLAYLHEDCHPRIIHRDIKSANILLDFSFEAKVADFGLAKLTQDNNTHVSTRVMGTFGYLAPEYASSGKLTDKSDVFSFGVVLLELITGRRPLDLTSDMDESLVDWARPLCMSAMEGGDFNQLVDPRLENNFVHHEMARMIACAGASIRHSARRRPKMRQIVRALEDEVSLDDLNVRPGQSSRFSSKGGSYDYDADSYGVEMNKIRKMASDSLESGSSEFGNTSEYGLNPSSSSSESSGTISWNKPQVNVKLSKA